jgi:hypothetical protein
LRVNACGARIVTRTHAATCLPHLLIALHQVCEA